MSKPYNYVQNNNTNVGANPLVRNLTGIILKLSWVVSPFLVKNIMLRQFFAPRSYKTSVKEQQLLNQGKQFTLQVNEQNIQCWRWGSGPAVVFAHGWNGSGIQFNAFIPEFVAAGYSVVVFDGPGHGISDGKTSSYFEMTDTVRAVLSFCRQNAIAAVIGHSFGASAIINALSKDEHNIPAVLIAPAMHIKEMLDQAFLIHGVPHHVYRNLIEEYENKFNYNLAGDNPANLLPDYSGPILIIHDRDDRVTSISESKYFTDQLENLELAVTEGLGHKRILNDGGVVQTSLKFITQQS